MAAAPQPSAPVNAVNEAAALVAKSLQSMTVAHVKNEELNNDAQIPVVIIGSFKYFQGDFETLFTISQGYDRYFTVLSESEYHSWQTYGWIRSPRVSDELASPQDQVHC